MPPLTPPPPVRVPDPIELTKTKPAITTPIQIPQQSTTSSIKSEPDLTTQFENSNYSIIKQQTLKERLTKRETYNKTSLSNLKNNQ